MVEGGKYSRLHPERAAGQEDDYAAEADAVSALLYHQRIQCCSQGWLLSEKSCQFSFSNSLYKKIVPDSLTYSKSYLVHLELFWMIFICKSEQSVTTRKGKRSMRQLHQERG